MTLAVIIPALNEGGSISAALDSAADASMPELIVVDGGSDDDTVSLALARGARVLTARRGRAHQLNAGAREAKAEVLLFLHADTILPPGYHEHVREILETPGVIAGAFRLGIDAPNRGLRVIEMLANWRSRRLQMPYGDQALFLRSATFHEAGGFPDSELMEDFELVRRLRKEGRIGIAPVAVRTSARRWIQNGILKTTLINQLAILAYGVGVSPAKIALWYYGNRRNSNDR